MSVLKAVPRSLLRRGVRSLVVLAVSLVIALFLNMYGNAISQHEQTLDELHASIEVTGYIISLDGNTQGLDIEEQTIKGLEESGFIREGIYTRKIWGMVGPWQELAGTQLSNKIYNSPRLIGANSITTFALPPEIMDGYDESLFASAEKVCLVSEDSLGLYGLAIGDELQYTAVSDWRNVRHSSVSLKIVGTYESPFRPAAIYCPLDVVTALYRELDLPVLTDSASFILQNTQELNQFRELLENLNFINQQAGSGSDYKQLSFIISDRLLKNATASVQSYIDFTTALYPVIYLLCAGIGFVVSYLLIRIRKPEFAIMRSLGTSKALTFLIFFAEQGVLCLLGAALGIFLTLATTQHISSQQFVTVIGYVVLYLVGASIAILTMNRVNVMQILTAKE